MQSWFLRVFGIKTVMRLGWRYLIYPKLKQWARSNDYPEWDEKLLAFINKNINKVIDLL